VQNAVTYEDLGVATSGATFFRSIGASFGVAVFGTIFTNRLTGKLGAALSGVTLPPGIDAGRLAADPRAISQLPPALRAPVIHAYSTSITDVFLYAAPVVLVAFVFAWFLKEDRLRGSVTAPDSTETLASNPVERSSYDECARALSVLATREGRRDVYVRIIERAGYDLLPAAGWMLLRIRRHGAVEPALLADATSVPLRVISEAARQLEERGLARREGVQLVLTDRGSEAVVELAEAREALLAELLGDWWGPDRPTDLVGLVAELAAETTGSSREQPRCPEPRRDHAL
jgi:DNA-binding MarR family transcriptional regulator